MIASPSLRLQRREAAKERAEIMLEYCVAKPEGTAPTDRVDVLDDIHADIKGMSATLFAMASGDQGVDPEQLLMCRGILELAADALEIVTGQLEEENRV